MILKGFYALLGILTVLYVVASIVAYASWYMNWLGTIWLLFGLLWFTMGYLVTIHTEKWLSGGCWTIVVIISVVVNAMFFFYYAREASFGGNWSWPLRFGWIPSWCEQSSCNSDTQGFGYNPQGQIQTSTLPWKSSTARYDYFCPIDGCRWADSGATPSNPKNPVGYWADALGEADLARPCCPGGVCETGCDYKGSEREEDWPDLTRGLDSATLAAGNTLTLRFCPGSPAGRGNPVCAACTLAVLCRRGDLEAFALALPLCKSLCLQSVRCVGGSLVDFVWSCAVSNTAYNAVTCAACPGMTGREKYDAETLKQVADWSFALLVMQVVFFSIMSCCYSYEYKYTRAKDLELQGEEPPLKESLLKKETGPNGLKKKKNGSKKTPAREGRPGTFSRVDGKYS